MKILGILVFPGLGTGPWRLHISSIELVGLQGGVTKATHSTTRRRRTRSTPCV